MSAAAPLAEAPRAPNVVLIVVDTLRRDHLGCYGYCRDVSPAIDRLAAESVLFEDAISPAPWTTPAIGSMMTSRYPTELQIHGDPSALPRTIETLAEILSSRGFDTGAVISHTFCSSLWGFDQGFESFDQHNIKGHGGITSAEITDTAIEFLERPRTRPFFLWVHYFDPHFAYQLHEDFDPDPRFDYEGPVTPGVDFGALVRLKNHGELREDDLRQVIRCYDSEIGLTDRHVGRLLEKLDALSLRDDTLLVFTADHGESFSEQYRLGHGNTLSFSVLNVPLIVRAPWLDSRRESRPVSLLDVAPTILAAVGAGVPATMRGNDLFTLLPEDGVFSETSRFGELRSLTTRRYKAILDLHSGETQLFDRTVDPLEEVDLAAREPLEMQALERRIQEWREQVSLAVIPAQEITISGKVREELDQLGYGGQ